MTDTRATRGASCKRQWARFGQQCVRSTDLKNVDFFVVASAEHDRALLARLDRHVRAVCLRGCAFSACVHVNVSAALRPACTMALRSKCQQGVGNLQRPGGRPLTRNAPRCTWPANACMPNRNAPVWQRLALPSQKLECR